MIQLVRQTNRRGERKLRAEKAEKGRERSGQVFEKGKDGNQ